MGASNIQSLVLQHWIHWGENSHYLMQSRRGHSIASLSLTRILDITIQVLLMHCTCITQAMPWISGAGVKEHNGVMLLRIKLAKFCHGWLCHSWWSCYVLWLSILNEDVSFLFDCYVMPCLASWCICDWVEFITIIGQESWLKFTEEWVGVLCVAGRPCQHINSTSGSGPTFRGSN